MGIERMDAELTTRWNVLVVEMDAETGAVLHVQKVHNLVTTGGLAEIARRVSLTAPSGEDQFAVGTGTTAPTVDDTTLETQVYKANVSRAEGGATGSKFNFVLGATAANGSTITEIGLLQYDDTLLARALLTTPITKTSGKTVAFVWNWVFVEASEVQASIVNIADAGGYFTATEVEAALQELAADSRGTVVADVTLTASWNSGASANAGTDYITVADATGLANGTPIEFYAGTGAIPAGLTAYTANLEGVADGDYYNIINLSGNTFQVTATLGGSTPVDITSAGTAGWQWRVAGNYTFPVTGLDLDTDIEYDVWYFLSHAKLTTAPTYSYMRFNNDSTNFKYFTTGTSLWGTNVAYVAGAFAQKYSITHGLVKVRKVADGLYAIRLNELSMDAPDRATGTARTTYNPPYYATSDTRNVTSLQFLVTATANGIFRNGSRVVVIRRGM